MRAHRRLAAFSAAASAALLVLLPGSAAANGGAYLDLDGTHFLPGQSATATAYVYLPRAQRGVLERGPFFAYLLAGGSTLERGAPVPEGAIRLGAFAVRHEQGKTYELELAFTVPEVAGASYSLAMCNDPCTVTGFGEPLTGLISVVETEREGELLTQQYRVEARLARARHQLRKAGRNAEDLQAQLDQGRRDNATLAAIVNELRSELETAGAAPARAEPAAADRPLVDGWAVAVAAAVLLALAAAIARRRRRPALAVRGS
jgi:hypothetical protein